MIGGVIKLFEDAATRNSAILVAAAAFVLGAIVMCIVCKLCGPCCKKAHSGKGACPTKSGAEKRERRRPACDEGTVEIYVGNLSYEVTDDVLLKEFSPFGQVASARVVFNHVNNRSKGFGFVHMPNRSEAEAAVKALNGKEVLGRKIKCNEARA